MKELFDSWAEHCNKLRGLDCAEFLALCDLQIRDMYENATAEQLAELTEIFHTNIPRSTMFANYWHRYNASRFNALTDLGLEFKADGPYSYAISKAPNGWFMKIKVSPCCPNAYEFESYAPGKNRPDNLGWGNCMEDFHREMNRIGAYVATKKQL